MVEAVILAVALSMDVTAVAAGCGASGMQRGAILRMATVFAVFHIAMATIGWMAGTLAVSWISTWDHWVALGLLAAIGTKMVVSALRPQAVAIPASWGLLLGLAVATSLDAVAAGVTLPLLAIPELAAVALIGGVVFCFTLAGARIGEVLGNRLGRVLQVVGGLAVIAVGIRIVLDHNG